MANVYPLVRGKKYGVGHVKASYLSKTMKRSMSWLNSLRLSFHEPPNILSLTDCQIPTGIGKTISRKLSRTVN